MHCKLRVGHSIDCVFYAIALRQLSCHPSTVAAPPHFFNISAASSGTMSTMAAQDERRCISRNVAFGLVLDRLGGVI